MLSKMAANERRRMDYQMTLLWYGNPVKNPIFLGRLPGSQDSIHIPHGPPQQHQLPKKQAIGNKYIIY